MKKFFISFLLALTFQWSFSQVPGMNSVSPFKEIRAFNWKTSNGLPYVNDFSGSYSVEVFQRLDRKRYAFLSKSTQAILVFNVADGQRLKTIHLPFSPVDFTVAGNRFFVAGTQNLYLLNANGKVVDKWFFGNQIKFVNSMKVVDGRIHLISSDQKTWSLDKTRQRFISHDGIILRNKLYGKVTRKGKHQFIIRLTAKGMESVYKTVTDSKTLGTIRILGMSGNLLFTGVQTVVNPVPLKVKREIRIYEVSASHINQVSSIPLPDVYYTYIKHDVVVSDSALDILVTTPEKARMYQLMDLEKVTSRKQIYLPSLLYQQSYLYNNHLLPAGAENAKNRLNLKNVPITRQQIISNAEPYATHKWYCNADNIKDYNCGGVHVLTPGWVTVGENISIPYMWGGFSSLTEFDQGIKDGVSAGDRDTHGNGAGSSCAVGVDCSGFVSRAWNLPNKYSTRSLPNISTAYSSYDDLLPGDIVNYAGHHVRLIHTVNGNGSFLIIESSASGTDWRVGYNNYTTADFQGKYFPRHYNDVIADNSPVDTINPTTTISANLWNTADFQVDFSDKDNALVFNRFYQVSYYNGSQWFANNKNGFFNDNFTNGISTQWTQSGSTWTNVGGALNQADETSTNTNIYAAVRQTAGNTYLYQWRMKIGGGGTNRRAGMYIMADKPSMSQRNNAYMIYFRVDQNTCQIYKSVGNRIDLKTSGACTVDAGVWFDAKVIYNTISGEIKVFKDNVLVSSWIDASPLTAGNSISLRTGNANVSYDNIKVYRSRTTSANVTVGANQDVPYQNFSPSLPACLILSVVTDSAYNFSAVDSAFVNIDWTAPEIYSVADGLGADADTTYDTTSLSANWRAAVDTNSGISAYRACIGSTPGEADVVPWFGNNMSTRFTETGLTLKRDSTYYVSVVATNAAGLMSDTISSDGILVLHPLSVSQNRGSETKFIVYPVPAKNILWVSSTGQEITGIPEVYDLSGRKMKVEVTKVSLKLWRVNLKTVVRGLYFVRVRTKTGYFSRKFSVIK